MTDEQMREYMDNGHSLFTIKSIDTIRDGGTKKLDTTGGVIYIHKDHRTFHSGYPTNDENLISDSLMIQYIVDRIEAYVTRSIEDVNRIEKLLVELKLQL